MWRNHVSTSQRNPSWPWIPQQAAVGQHHPSLQLWLAWRWPWLGVTMCSWHMVYSRLCFAGFTSRISRPIWLSHYSHIKKHFGYFWEAPVASHKFSETVLPYYAALVAAHTSWLVSAATVTVNIHKLLPWAGCSGAFQVPKWHHTSPRATLYLGFIPCCGLSRESAVSCWESSWGCCFTCIVLFNSHISTTLRGGYSFFFLVFF